MIKKRGLGKGLGALIPDGISESEISSSTSSIEVAIDHISPNPHQPRQNFNQAQLQELADSIAQHGLIQPLIVTQIGQTYQLIAGERRWRACQLIGLSTVPIIIKESTPQQMLELALVENIQRADLNPLEEAEAYTQLITEFGLTQEAVAERVGKSRTAVANILRLLNLPPEIKQALSAGEISEGHARTLLSLKETDQQLKILATVIQRGLNVRQTEAMVRQLSADNREMVSKVSVARPLTPHERSILTKFESKLGTRVELSHTDKDAGKIVIHFYSPEDFQTIFEAILGKDELL